MLCSIRRSVYAGYILGLARLDRGESKSTSKQGQGIANGGKWRLTYTQGTLLGLRVRLCFGCVPTVQRQWGESSPAASSAAPP